MTDKGGRSKELVEGERLHIDRDTVENGSFIGEQGSLEDGRWRTNRVGHDVKDRDSIEGVMKPVAVGEVSLQPQQPSQGTSVCWESFLHLRSVRVLLVENDDCTRHIVAGLLRNCSYEAVEASNGLQAWKVLEDLTNRVDVVLTEVVMPCLSGIALLCKIMSHKTRKNVPVISKGSSCDSFARTFS